MAVVIVDNKAYTIFKYEDMCEFAAQTIGDDFAENMRHFMAEAEHDVSEAQDTAAYYEKQAEGYGDDNTALHTEVVEIVDELIDTIQSSERLNRKKLLARLQGLRAMANNY